MVRKCGLSGRVGGRKTIRSSKENGINHDNSSWKYISIKYIKFMVVEFLFKIFQNIFIAFPREHGS